MQDSERHAGTATGIDGVSTCVQNRIPGSSGKIMTGGDGMAVTVECWAHMKSSSWVVNVKQIELWCSLYSQIETFSNSINR
jgi:hypothetical protein